MACGCESPCGCNVVGIGYVDVTREGDTFKVGVNMPIKFVADTDCIGLSVDDETRTLRAVPILADAAVQDASVQLRCSQDGLAGDVVIDPASSAPVTLTADGLRIDLPAPLPSAESASPGTLKVTSALGEEAGWLDADGGEVQRLAFPGLHDAVSLVSTQGGRTLGSNVVTNARTKYLKAGLPAEITGFPPGMTVTAITGAYTFTVSDVAFSDGGDSIVRVYPYGNGDGNGTFNVPLIGADEFVKQMAAGEGLGTGGGQSATSIEIANLPPHEHAGSTCVDTGHDHGVNVSVTATSTAVTTLAIPADGSHYHVAGQNPNPDAHFVVIDEPVVAADFIAIPTIDGLSFTPGTGGGTLNKTDAISIPTHYSPAVGIINHAQGERAGTSYAGSHDHAGATATTTVTPSVSVGVDVVPDTAHNSLDIAVEGGGVDLENRPAFRAFRWVVKT